MLNCLKRLYFLDFEAWKGLWMEKGSLVHISLLKQPINYILSKLIFDGTIKDMKRKGEEL